MNKEVIRDVKILAGFLYFYMVFEAGYNIAETVRHTVLGDEVEHIMRHFFAGMLGLLCTVAFYKSGWYLWREFKDWWNGL